MPLCISTAIHCDLPCLALKVTFAFSEAITVGIFNEEKGAPVLNPPGWTVIEPGDKILVVAEDDDAYKPDREPVIEAVSPGACVCRRDCACVRVCVCVCGFQCEPCGVGRASRGMRVTS
jgi:hypothetical protein